jgi:aspartate/methionine/tyrosine aminotransferase
MIEVCATKLPQMAIPRIMAAPQYKNYQKERNEAIGKRSKIITDILEDTPTITFNETFGAFYNTIIFKEGTLKADQKLRIDDPRIEAALNQWIEADPHMAQDKRFVYYLLAAKGVCVVPISSFCSDLQGFRVTLLEEEEALLKETFTLIKEAVMEYTEASVVV